MKEDWGILEEEKASKFGWERMIQMKKKMVKFEKKKWCSSRKKVVEFEKKKVIEFK